MQMRRTRFPDEGPLILDLSFNELVVSDTPTLVSMLSHHPQLVVRVAHNKMNFAGLLHLAINDGGGPILHRQVV